MKCCESFLKCPTQKMHVVIIPFFNSFAFLVLIVCSQRGSWQLSNS